jgi:hypothetical protein
LDDGKILTGKPDQFDGKNHGFRLRFSPTNQSNETNPNWEWFIVGFTSRNIISFQEASERHCV